MDLFNPILVKKYEDILTQHPESKVFYPLAQIYRMKKQLKKAEELCLEGLTHHPNHSPAYITLAQIYRDQHKIEKSIKTLKKAQELSPDNPQIYQIFGEIYQDQKNMEKSLWAYKMVLFLSPWDSFAKKIVEQLEKPLLKEETSYATPTAVSLQSKTLTQKKKMEKLQKLLRLVDDKFQIHS